MLGIRCTRVVFSKRCMRSSPLVYWRQRYFANKSNSSLPTTSFPCMLATYLNSGLPVINKYIIHFFYRPIYGTRLEHSRNFLKHSILSRTFNNVLQMSYARGKINTREFTESSRTLKPF